MVERCNSCSCILDKNEVWECTCCEAVTLDPRVHSNNNSFSWDLYYQEQAKEVRKLEVEIEAVQQAIDQSFWTEEVKRLTIQRAVLQGMLKETLAQPNMIG